MGVVENLIVEKGNDQGKEGNEEIEASAQCKALVPIVFSTNGETLVLLLLQNLPVADSVKSHRLSKVEKSKFCGI